MDFDQNLIEFDPKSDRFMDSPWEFYRRLRSVAPVYLDSRHGIYFVTSYRLVDEVMKDAKRFSSQVDRASMRKGGLPDRVRQIRAGATPLALTMSQNDAPSHDIFKALVSPFFTPRNLTRLEPFIRKRARELVDEIGPNTPIDFVNSFAVPLPIAVIGQALGMRDCGDDRLKRWSDAFADEIGLLTSDARAVEIAELTLECHKTMLEICALRRSEPQDDIISHLVGAQIADETGQSRPLQDGELLSMLTQMLVAGNETTTNTLSGGMLRLASEPQLFSRLRNEPTAIPMFVEEILRLESPVQGQFRRAIVATQLDEVEIPAGALLHCRLASANRDELVYGPQSDQLNLDSRSPAPHKSFGSGMHFCLGAMLSRLELRLAFELITQSFERAELAPDSTGLRYHTHFHLRGLESLPIVLG